jgi:hypothetical protein
LRIAALAWGSLVWTRGDFAIETAFEPNGPLLSIEFSRVSGNGRLTLVINLHIREGMLSVKGVGFIDRLTSQRSAKAIERHPHTVETIDAWAAANGYEAVIWTAIASNFREADRGGEPFSVGTAKHRFGLSAQPLCRRLGRRCRVCL